MPKGRKKGGRQNVKGSREPSDDEFGGQDTPDDASVASTSSSNLEPIEGDADFSSCWMAFNKPTSAGSPLSDLDPESVTFCTSHTDVTTESCDLKTALNEEVDETSAQEDFEEKLKDCIDGTMQKSAKGRQNCLQGMCQAFSKKIIYDFVLERKVTINDSLEKRLKKGGGEEQAIAAKCAVLQLLQLGAGPDAEECFKALQPIMQIILADNSASLKARSSCATALGLSAFIACSDILEVQNLMKILETIFKQSYLKGDGSTPLHSPELAELHASALSSWELLLSIAPTSAIRVILDNHLPRLPELLTSNHVDLRIVAGETIALLYELAREVDEDFEGDHIDDLCATLKQLATDSNKYRAKKDRRQQRSSFRDILKTVEEAAYPEYSIKFGTEVLDIWSWVQKKQYDMLCNVLGSGMNAHLQSNVLLREIFGLGEPILEPALNGHRMSKYDKRIYADAFKARTKCRAKARDKRNAAIQDS